MAQTIRQTDPHSLKAHPRNARQHSRRQITHLMESLGEFGFIKPIVVDENNVILAGHGVWQAAQEMEMEKVPITVISGLTDEQKRAYVIADNRLGEMSRWDRDLVAAELKDLQAFPFETLKAWELFEGANATTTNQVGADRHLLQIELEDEPTLQMLFEELRQRNFVCKILT